jgi:hypothetical protein
MECDTHGGTCTLWLNEREKRLGVETGRGFCSKSLPIVETGLTTNSKEL